MDGPAAHRPVRPLRRHGRTGEGPQGPSCGLPHPHSRVSGRGAGHDDQPIHHRDLFHRRPRPAGRAGHQRHRLSRRGHHHRHRPASGQGPDHRRRAVGLGLRGPCRGHRLLRGGGHRLRGHLLRRAAAVGLRPQAEQPGPDAGAVSVPAGLRRPWRRHFRAAEGTDQSGRSGLCEKRDRRRPGRHRHRRGSWTAWSGRRICKKRREWI